MLAFYGRTGTIFLCYKVTPPARMPYLATFLCALEPCNFTTMMTKFFPIVNVFICVFVTVQAAAVSPQNCGETFESQLRELLATKKTCNSAAFYDCCQVKRIIANIIYYEPSPHRSSNSFQRHSLICMM